MGHEQEPGAEAEDPGDVAAARPGLMLAVIEPLIVALENTFVGRRAGKNMKTEINEVVREMRGALDRIVDGEGKTFASYIVLCLAMAGCSDALSSAPPLASWNGTIVPGETRTCCVTPAESACGSPSSNVVVEWDAGSPCTPDSDAGIVCVAIDSDAGPPPCAMGQACSAVEVTEAGPETVILAGQCTADSL